MANIRSLPSGNWNAQVRIKGKPPQSKTFNTKARFQVKTVGPKAYHIVDLITGKTCGFRFEYASAVDFAIQLEEKANRLPGGAQ
jgi:hypothetical protein